MNETDRDLRPIRTVVREELDPTPVFSVEDGRVWFSGMNARLYLVAYRVACVLDDEGYTVGRIEDDGVHAARNGGIVLNVEEARQDRVPEGVVSVSEEWDDEDVEAFRMSFEDDPETWERITNGRLRGFEIDGATDEEVRAAVEEADLPLEFDPERLHTEGASTSPSTFEERERRGESRLDRVRRLLRGLIP